MKNLIISFWADESEKFFYLNEQAANMISGKIIEWVPLQEEFFESKNVFVPSEKCELAVEAINRKFSQEETEYAVIVAPKSLRESIITAFTYDGWLDGKIADPEEDFLFFVQEEPAAGMRKCYIIEERKNGEPGSSLRIDSKMFSFTFNQN